MPARPVTTIVSDTVTGTVEGAWAAAQMPFEDLNLTRQDIPEPLQKIAENPYALPPQLLCDDLHKQISELNTLLGPDICVPQNIPLTPAQQPASAYGCPTGEAGETSRKGEYVEKGVGIAKQRTVDLVTSKVNIIPFRGVVRNLTGAEKHAREVERAYQAGKLHRAFLKGLATTLCRPAAVTPLPPKASLPPVAPAGNPSPRALLRPSQPGAPLQKIHP